MSGPQRNKTDANQLLAFENRYTGPHASRLSPTAETSEQHIHDILVDEYYGRLETSTQNAFEGFCNKHEYHLLDTSAIKGELFLQAERQRHVNPR